MGLVPRKHPIRDEGLVVKGMRGNCFHSKINKLVSIKNAPQLPVVPRIPAQGGGRRGAGATVYKFINPGMRGARATTTTTNEDHRGRSTWRRCPGSDSVLGTHSIPFTRLARERAMMLILDHSLAGHQHQRMADAKNERALLSVRWKIQFSFPRQHELFNEPRLDAFMQMGGLINTKTVA